MAGDGERLQRRGGCRQQLERGLERERERSRSRSPRCSIAGESHLAHNILVAYAMGHLSARRASQYARAGTRDGLQQLALGKLARIGSEGRNEQNCRRELMGKFAKLNLVTELDNSAVSCIVYPHELFAFIYENYPRQFVKRFGADVAKLSTFWECLYATPLGRELMENHPHIKDREHLERTIPIFTHVDAGAAV